MTVQKERISPVGRAVLWDLTVVQNMMYLTCTVAMLF